MTLVAAIDIGGTKTAAALVRDDGTLVARTQLPTPAGDGPRAVLDTAAEAVRSLGGDPAAAGVGSAGVIDPRAGTVLSATSALPGWPGVRLREELSGRLGVPVSVDNDVNAHALGETWRGAAAGLSTVLLVAVGTGVGACVLLDGRIHHGAGGAAGEAGHVPVPSAAGLECTCGGSGHVEAVAAGPAMTRAHAERTGSPVPLREIARLAGEGDPEAVATVRTGARALGEMTGGLVNMLAPDAVLLTGGATNCGEPWWEELRRATSEHTVPAVSGTPLRAGELGSEAALYGAALLGLRALAGTDTGQI